MIYILTVVDSLNSIKDQFLIIMENIETVYEKTATLFWNSGKAEVAKKYNEKRVYPILLKD